LSSSGWIVLMVRTGQSRFLAWRETHFGVENQEKRRKGGRKAKKGFLLLLDPSSSTVFGDETAKVPGNNCGMQRIACLHPDPVWSQPWRRGDGLCCRGRRYLPPVLAVLRAHNDSCPADDPSDLFRCRRSGKQIGGHAARLWLPGLPLIGGMLYAPARAQPPKSTAVRRAKHNWLDRILSQSFQSCGARYAGCSVEVSPCRPLAHTRGRGNRGRRRRRGSCGSRSITCWGLLLGSLSRWKSIIFCSLLASL
jgi:hypothetical protein